MQIEIPKKFASKLRQKFALPNYKLGYHRLTFRYVDYICFKTLWEKVVLKMPINRQQEIIKDELIISCR